MGIGMAISSEFLKKMIREDPLLFLDFISRGRPYMQIAEMPEVNWCSLPSKSIADLRIKTHSYSVDEVIDAAREVNAYDVLEAHARRMNILYHSVLGGDAIPPTQAPPIGYGKCKSCGAGKLESFYTCKDDRFGHHGDQLCIPCFEKRKQAKTAKEVMED